MRHVDEQELKVLFDDLLREIYPMFTIAGHRYDIAKVFKKTDPVTYELEFRTYVDGLLKDGILINKNGDFFIPAQKGVDL